MSLISIIVFCHTLLTLLLSGTLAQKYQSKSSLVDSFVTNQLDSTGNRIREGSIFGGTLLQVVLQANFDEMVNPFDFQIILGESSCKIKGNLDGGSSSDGHSIICETQAASSEMIVAVEVVETSTGKVLTCANVSIDSCQFTYTDFTSKTRTEYSIPLSIFPGETLSYCGVWEDQQAIKEIRIGEEICEILNISNDSCFSCQTQPTISSGLYPAQLRADFGYIGSKKLSSSFLPQGGSSVPTEVQVIPLITGIEESAVTSIGGIITILMRGLSETSTISAYYYNHSCKLLSQSTSQFSCVLNSKIGDDRSDQPLTQEDSLEAQISTSGVLTEWFTSPYHSLDSVVEDYEHESRRMQKIKTEMRPTIDISTDFLIDNEKLAERVSSDHNGYASLVCVMTGFFVAPASGDYMFFSSSNDHSRFYLQLTNKQTKDLSTYKLLNQITEGTRVRSFYKSDGEQGNQFAYSHKIELEKGREYSFVVFVLNRYHKEKLFHSTGMRMFVQNGNKGISQLVRVRVRYDFSQRVIKLAMNESFSTSIQINLSWKDKDIISEEKQKLDTLFLSGHSACWEIERYIIMQSRKAKKPRVAQVKCEEELSQQQRIWKISFTNALDESDEFIFLSSSSKENNVDSGFSAEVLDKGDQPIQPSSSFYLKISTNKQTERTLKVSFGSSANEVKEDFRKLLGLRARSVDVWKQGSGRSNVDWYLEIFDNDQQAQIMLSKEDRHSQKLKIDHISVEVDTIFSSDSAVHYPVIPNEFLVQKSVKPTVRVYVDGVLAVCGSEIFFCGLRVMNSELTTTSLRFSIIDSEKDYLCGQISVENIEQSNCQKLSRSVSLLEVTGLSMVLNLPQISKKQFTVFLNHFVCESVKLDSLILQAECKGVPAGSYLPFVAQKGVGLVLSESMQEVQIPLIMAEGILESEEQEIVIIEGKNFPLDSSELNVNVSGILACIVHLESEKLTIELPQLDNFQESYNILVSSNKMSFDSTSTRLLRKRQASLGPLVITNNPKIKYINQSIISPVEKQVITITGSDFDTDKTLFTVSLDKINSKNRLAKRNKYILQVMSASEESLSILFEGGEQARYRLIIKHQTRGKAIPVCSNEEWCLENRWAIIEFATVITSISPVISSVYGGALLTISGFNFAWNKINDSLVFIKYSQSEQTICQIRSATREEIVCILPDLSKVIEDNIELQTEVQVWSYMVLKAKTKDLQIFNVIFSTQKTITLGQIQLESHGIIARETFLVEAKNIQEDTVAARFQSKTTEEVVIAKVTKSTKEGKVGLFTVETPHFDEGAGEYFFALEDKFGRSQEVSLFVNAKLASCQRRSVMQEDITSEFSELQDCDELSINGQEIALRIYGLGIYIDEMTVFCGDKQIEILAKYPTEELILLRIEGIPEGTCTLTVENRKRLLEVKDALKINSLVPESECFVESIIVNDQEITVKGNNLNKLKYGYLHLLGKRRPKGIADIEQFIQGQFQILNSGESTVIKFPAVLGNSRLILVDDKAGYAKFASREFQKISREIGQLETLYQQSDKSSYAGGMQLITVMPNIIENRLWYYEAKVCDRKVDITKISSSNLSFKTPKIITKEVAQHYNLEYEEQIEVKIIEGENCDSQIDVGEEYIYLQVSRVTLQKSFIKFASAITSGSSFQGSVDNLTWHKVFSISKSNFKQYKTSWDIKEDQRYPFRYYRFADSKDTPFCVAQFIQIQGIRDLDRFKKLNSQENSIVCRLTLFINGVESKPAETELIYLIALTAQLIEISPFFADINQKTKLTLIFNKMPTFIEKQQNDLTQFTSNICSNPSLGDKSNEIQCIATPRSFINNEQINITFALFNIFMEKNVRYYSGSRWSNPMSWGGSLPPQNGDTVHLRDSKVILLDVSYVGVLKALIIEEKSTLLILGDQPIHLEVQTILINSGGKIQIGSIHHPAKADIRITFTNLVDEKSKNSNGRIFSIPQFQQPGLYLVNGKLDVHGEVRHSQKGLVLKQDVRKGESTIIISYIKGDRPDLREKDELMISVQVSLDSNGKENFEVKTIQEIRQVELPQSTSEDDSEYLEIGVTSPFTHSFYGDYNISDKSFLHQQTQTQVRLLSRNIHFIASEQGGAIYLANSIVNLDCVEFKGLGSPQQGVSESISSLTLQSIKNNSYSYITSSVFRDSLGRMIELKGSNGVKIANNIGLNCIGHGIIIDLLSQDNNIEGNSIYATKSSSKMFASELRSAAFYVANPINFIVNNTSINSQGFGFLLDLREFFEDREHHIEQYKSKFVGNSAFSNSLSGLVIKGFKGDHHSIQMVCEQTEEINLPSWYFQNFTSVRNNQSGIIVEAIKGTILLSGLVLVENSENSLQFVPAQSNFLITKQQVEAFVQITDSNFSKCIDINDIKCQNQMKTGLVISDSINFKLSSTNFFGFDLETHSKSIIFAHKDLINACYLPDSLFSYNLTIKWGESRNDLIQVYLPKSDNPSQIDQILFDNQLPTFDENPNLNKSSNQEIILWVTPLTSLLSSLSDCSNLNTRLGIIDTVECKNQVVNINLIVDNNLENKDLSLSVFEINNKIDSKEPSSEPFNGNLLVGQTYRVLKVHGEIKHFSKLSVSLNSQLSDSIVLVLNYENQEYDFSVTDQLSGIEIDMSIDQSLGQTMKCKDNQWLKDETSRFLFLCIGKDKKENRLLVTTKIPQLQHFVQLTCTTNQEDNRLITIKHSQIKDSNQFEAMTTTNKDSLLIPCGVSLIIDEDITQYVFIIIQGSLRIDPSATRINIITNGIYIAPAGEFLAIGEEENIPFEGYLTIILDSIQMFTKEEEKELVSVSREKIGITAQDLNFSIINKGRLVLESRTSFQDKLTLTKPLIEDQKQVYLNSDNYLKVGDKIGIGPSAMLFDEPSQQEIFEIKNVLNEGEILELNNLTQFIHSSESEEFSQSKSSFPAKVVSLSRKIQIGGGKCRIISSMDNSKEIVLIGVEVVGCGDHATMSPSIEIHYSDEQNIGMDQQQSINSKSTTNSEEQRVVIQQSTLVQCKGVCLRLIGSSSGVNSKITQNIFFDSYHRSLEMLHPDEIDVSENILIGTKKVKGGNMGEPSLLFLNITSLPHKFVQVSNNIAIGSPGSCFVLPLSNCDETKSNVIITSNTAQLCGIGVDIISNKENKQCSMVKGVFVQDSQTGLQIISPNSTLTMIDNFIGKTCNIMISITLETSETIQINQSQLHFFPQWNRKQSFLKITDNNSYDKCLNSLYAMIQLKIQIQIKRIQDAINSAFYGQIYINDSQIFHDKFSEEKDSAISNNVERYTCPENNGSYVDSLFKIVSDTVIYDVGAYFSNLKCENFNQQQYLQLFSQQDSEKVVPSQQNILFMDTDGCLFNGNRAAIIQTSEQAAVASCKLIHPSENNFYCLNIEYVLLEILAISGKAGTQLLSPVYLISQQDKITFRATDQIQDADAEFQRFILTIIARNTYQVSFNGSGFPHIFTTRIQQRYIFKQNNEDEWVILSFKLHPMQYIEVLNQNEKQSEVIIAPELQISNKLCGSNSFNLLENELLVVVSDSFTCNLRIMVRPAIRIKVLVKGINLDDFITNRQVSFLSWAMGALEITDYSRVKIAGVEKIPEDEKNIRKSRKKRSLQEEFVILAYIIYNKPETQVVDDIQLIMHEFKRDVKRKLSDRQSSNYIFIKLDDNKEQHTESETRIQQSEVLLIDMKQIEREEALLSKQQSENIQELNTFNSILLQVLILALVAVSILIICGVQKSKRVKPAVVKPDNFSDTT